MRPSAGRGPIGRLGFCVLILVALAVSACSGAKIYPPSDRSVASGNVGELLVSSFRILYPEKSAYSVGGVATADLTVVNNGTGRDVLLSASSPAAESVRLLKFGEPQAQAPIESGGQRVNGILLQLVNLRQKLEVGQTIPVTLRFRNAGALTLSVPVQRTPVNSSASSH